MNHWHLIAEGQCSSLSNMESDLRLFEAVQAGQADGIVRIYDWDEPAVTIGHHQNHFTTFDRHLTIPVIQRPTGGGAVLHDHDITFSISVPETGMFAHGITPAYTCISRVFARALRDCGLAVRMEGKDTRFSPVCFARSSPVELVIEGRKLMGIALLRSRGCLLLQGVVPLRVNRDLVGRTFGPEHAENSCGLLEIFPDFRHDAFIGHLILAFASELGITLFQGHDNEAHGHHAEEGKVHPRGQER